MTWNTVRAGLVGVIALALVAALLVVGFVALLVLVPVGIVVFLLVRHRLRERMGAMDTRTFTWSSGGTTRASSDIEGVVIDVTVEDPDGAARATLEQPVKRP
jgi:hypothetical protein